MALAGCNKDNPPPSDSDGGPNPGEAVLALRLSLGPSFRTQFVTGFEVAIGRAPGGPSLGLTARAPRDEAIGAVTASTAHELGPDAEIRWVARVSGNPFAGVLELPLRPDGLAPGTPISVRVDLLGERGVIATLPLTRRPDGTLINFPAAGRVELAGTIPCVSFVSCATGASANRTPVLAALSAAPGPIKVRVGSTVRFRVDAFDADGDLLSFSLNADDVERLPGVASLDPSTRVFSWVPTASAEPESLRFAVSDGRGGRDEKAFVFSIGDASQPLANPTSTRIAAEGRTFVQVVEASDADGDAIAYEVDVQDLPDGADATFDEATHSLRWTPLQGDARERPYVARVVIRDATGLETPVPVPIAVIDADEPPLLSGPDEATAKAGASTRLTFVATDPEADAITLSADLSALPAGAATFDGVSSVLTLTPSATAVRDAPYEVPVVASDGRGGAARLVVKVRVVDANTAPVAAPPSPAIITEGDALKLRVDAADAEGDAFTATLDPNDLPASSGAVYDATAKELRWTPAAGSARDYAYSPRVVFTDSKGARSTIVVPVLVRALRTPTPRAPVILTTAPIGPANNNDPVVRGQGQAGMTVRLFNGPNCRGTPLGEGPIDGNGEFRVLAHVQDDTTTAIYGRAVRADGHVSRCSTSFATYVEDSTPPDVPRIDATAPASPANNNDPVVRGTAEPKTGILVFTNAQCAGEPAVPQLRTDDAGHFAVAVHVADNATTSLAAIAVDDAGNRSECSVAFDYVEDSHKPPSPTLTATDPPSPANENNPYVVGTTQANARVRVYTDPTCILQVAEVYADATGAFRARVSVADNSVTNFYAQTFSLTGNASDCSAGITYREDSMTPDAPTLTGTIPTSPSRQTNVRVQGTTRPGATVRLYKSADCALAQQTGTGTAGPTGSFDIPVVVEPNFTTTFYAKATDTLGHETRCSMPGLVFVHDSAPPLAPTGLSTAPIGPANNNHPDVLGTTEPGATVTIFTNNACTGVPAGTGLAGPTGAFRASVTVADNSTTTFFARATDAAGNVSACSTSLATYVENSMPPATPVFTASVPASPSRTGTNPIIQGTAQPGTEIRLFTADGCSGTPTATGFANAFRQFSIGITVRPNTVTTLYALAADDQGNVSPCTAIPFVYIHDNLPPAPPNLASTVPVSPSRSVTTPVVQGSAEAAAVVALFTSAGCVGTEIAHGSASASGFFSIGVTAAENATTRFYGLATDAAGNVSSCSALPIAYTHDSVPPSPPNPTGSIPASPSNQSSPRITGTAEASSRVRLYADGACAGAIGGEATADETGSFSIQVAVSPNSSTAFFGVAIDVAGNQSACSGAPPSPQSFLYVQDSTAPAAPSGLATTPVSPANENHPSIAGRAEAGSTVRIFATPDCSGSPRASATADAAGLFSATADVADNTFTTFYAQATDRAGNPSPCSQGVPFFEDSTPPPPPTFTGTTPASPTRVTTTPALQGTTEAGATVRIYRGAGCTGAAISTLVAQGGSFSATVTAVANTTSQFSATSTDGAGNTSACTPNPVTFTHDSVAPAPPIIARSTPSSPSQTSTQPTLTGTTEAGATLRFYLTSGCASGVVGLGVATTAGAFSLPVTVPPNTVSQIFATATDIAGNTSPCSPTAFIYVHDNRPPDAPVLASTTPSSPSRTQLSPTLRGTAEANSLVTIYTSAACGGQAAGNVVADAQGAFSLAVTVPANSTTSFYATATDNAGNVSACSAGRAYVHDSTPPAPPSLGQTVPRSPANELHPHVVGTTEPGATVQLFPVAGCAGGATGTGLADDAGRFDVVTTVFMNQTSVLSATATDAAGNTSACSTTTLSYVEDSTAPAVPSIQASAPTSPSRDSTTPLLSGTADAFVSVAFYTASTCTGTVAATVTTDSTGHFSAQVTVADNSSTTFFAAATSLAGNVSACSPGFLYVHDTLPPNAPTGLSLAPASPSNQPSPVLSGSAPAGSTVRIYSTGSCAGSPVATVTASASGSFSTTVPVAPNATTTFRATSSDAAGNVSSCSASAATYVMDNVPPVAPTLTATAPASPSNGTLSPEVLGTAEARAIVRVYPTSDCSGAPTGTGAADTSGAFSIAVTARSNATTSFYATATDSAGNVSPCSTTFASYVHDTTPPAAPVLVSTTPASPSGFSTTPLVAGTGEPGTTVRLFGGGCTGTAIGQGTVDDTGAFAISVSVPSNSTTVLYGNARDAAGNVSPCSDTSLTYVHDTTVPPVPAGLTVTPTSPANNNRPTIFGTAPPSSTVRVYPNADCGGMPAGTTTANAAGSFSVTVDVADNTQTLFHATATDRAGNSSPCSTSEVAYVEDSLAPPAPTLQTSLPPSPSRTANPTLRGIAEASATVRLFTDSACSSAIVGSTTAGLSGAFSLVVNVPQNATTLFYAQALDAAANASPCSLSGFPYTHDSVPPSTPVVSGTTPSSPSRDTTTPFVNGSAEAGSRIFVYSVAGCGSGLLGSGTVAQNGQFSVQVNVPANSSTLLYARVVDPADNASACTTTGVPYLHDNIPPNPPVFTGSTPASPSKTSTTPIIAGTAESGSTVRLFVGTGCTGAPVASGVASGGTFSLAVSVNPETATSFYGTATDGVGNLSGCTPTPFVYVHDSLPPSPPTALATTPPSPANQNSPSVTGVAEAGSTVRLFTTSDCSGTPVATGASVGGAFSIAVTVADDSTTTFAATATDASGNASTCSTARVTYVEDSTPPAPPVLTGTAPSSPSRTSTSPTVQGTAEANSTVRIYGSAGCSGTALAQGAASGTGAFAIQTPVSPNSTTIFYATATDGAGNVSTCSTAGRTFIHDDTPPAAPTGLSSTPASPANNNGPTITGSAEAGSVVRLFTDAACSGTAIASATAASGTFSMTIAVADDSTTTLRATATDAAGNASTCSAPYVYVEDSTPPAAPTFSGSTPASPSRTALTPVINGSAEAGATVRLYRVSGCSGSPAGQGVATGGTFAIQVTVAANSSSTFYGRAVDAAGNASACSTTSFTYIHDDTPPAAPLILSSTPTSPSSTSISPVLTGTAEANSAVRIYTQPGCGGAIVASTTATAQGAFAVVAPAADNSTVTFYANAVDVAGNVSTCSMTGLTYTHDNVPPSTPTNLVVSPSPPANNNSPQVTGTAEVGAIVRLFTTATCTGTPVASGTVGAGGTFTLTASVADDSATAFRAVAVDAAGNSSPCSASVTYVEDSTPPLTPVFGPSSPPSPSSTSSSPTIQGTSEPASRVRIFTQAGCTGAEAANVTADAGGAWHVIINVTPNSVTRFYAVALDAAQNASPCTSAPFTYIHDDSPPLAPVLTGTTPTSPSNTSTTPTLNGTGEANATLRVFINPSCSGTPLTTAAVSPSGTFAVNVTVSPNSTTTLYAQAVDVAGNASPCSAGLSYSHDSLPPAAPVLSGTTPASPTNASTTPAVNGTAEPTSTVRLYANAACTGTPLGTATASSGGAFSATITVTANTSTSLYGTATDGAGNTSACSASALLFIHDATAPSAPAGLATLPTSPANNNNPALSGTGEAGATVSVYRTATCTGAAAATGTVQPGGAFSVTVSVTDNSTNTFSAKLTDAAGNASACSASLPYVEDSTPPTPPVFTGTSPASPTNASTTPLIQGTAEVASTVRLYTTADCSGAVVGTGVANGSGLFSIQVSVTSNSSTTYRATSTDASGNVSTCTTTGQTFTHDSITPAAPTIVSASPTSPTRLTTTPTFSGTAEPSALVRLYGTSNCSGTPAGVGSATAGGAFSISAQVTANATTILRGTATDLAGNVSPCAVAGFVFVHDSVAPAAPTDLVVAPTPPSPISTPTLVGTAEIDSTVSVYTSATCSGTPVATGTASGQSSFGISISVPLNATTLYYLSARDAAGNVSACSAPISYTHDDTPPPAPALTSTTPATTSSSPSSTLCPTIFGTTEPSGSVNLYRGSACSGASDLTVAADGTGAFNAQLCVSAASTAFYASTRDAAGNTSACAAPLTYYYAPQYTLTVTRSGGGSVASSPAGISCGSTCAAPFTSGTTVTLTATVPTGYTFGGWSGDCASTSGLTCTVNVTAARNVTATFVNDIPLVAPQIVSGTGNCSTVYSNTGRKIALDDGRNVYAGFVCGADAQIAASAPNGSANNVGQVWRAPVTVVSGNVLDLELLGGASGAALALVLQQNTSSDAKVLLVRTTDGGLTWSAPVTLVASGASPTWGVSLARSGTTAFAAASVSSKTRVLKSTGFGTGPWTSVDVNDFTSYGDVRVDASTGKVYALGDTYNLHLWESADGAVFNALTPPASLGAFESDWAVVGGNIVVSGSDSVYRLAVSNPSVAITIGGLASTAPRRERGLDAAADGTLYVVTRGDPSQTSGAVYLERATPGATSVTGLRTLAATDGTSPSVVAGPGNNVAIVAYTSLGGKVYVTVQPY